MARRNGGFVGQDGLDAPDPPTGVTPTAGNESVSVAFTAPTDTGTSAITGFVATTDAGDGATGSSSPITISSLTNGTAYTTKVYAINAYGTSSPSDASASFTPALQRGLFSGGLTSAGRVNVIQYISIATTGNAQDFGDLTVARGFTAGCSSSTRSITAGGQSGGSASDKKDEIDFVTFATLGNATDFGNLLAVTQFFGGLSNSTRGVFAGEQSENNVMQYITIASEGNSQDFGDLTLGRADSAGAASTTRGVFAGGDGSSGDTNIIDYITIANTGNATDFGDLTAARDRAAGASSSTRAVFGGGHNVNTIDYITIASAGNATDFGDLTTTAYYHGGLSSKTRAVFGGGNRASSSSNVMDYITIASTGDAADFGDLLAANEGVSDGTSNCHGGIAA